MNLETAQRILNAEDGLSYRLTHIVRSDHDPISGSRTDSIEYSILVYENKSPIILECGSDLETVVESVIQRLRGMEPVEKQVTEIKEFIKETQEEIAKDTQPKEECQIVSMEELLKDKKGKRKHV